MRILPSVYACAPNQIRGAWHHNKPATMSMSSKSLTAVTSFVSVIRDKTVFVLRLNVKGCQRVAVPIAMIVSYLLAVGLLVAAGATDQMIRVSFLKEQHTS